MFLHDESSTYHFNAKGGRIAHGDGCIEVITINRGVKKLQASHIKGPLLVHEF